MKIISFEGIEGVGKSTQINMLNDHLKVRGLKTEILREPGSTVTGEKIRDILLNSSDELADEAELLLMFASRAQLMKEKVLDSNLDFILFDRFYDASIAYQGYGRNISLDFIFSLVSFINCPAPDITFLLDINVDDGFSRKVDDVKDRIESSGLDFFNNVREGYLKVAKSNPERVKVLDASKTIEDVHDEIIEYVNKIL